jgi:hypothetical protein
VPKHISPARGRNTASRSRIPTVYRRPRRAALTYIEALAQLGNDGEILVSAPRIEAMLVGRMDVLDAVADFAKP